MKRVAVITDIHGNLRALEASLAAIDAVGFDGLFCRGHSSTHDAEAVAREVAAAGLPGEYAEKLLAAA